MPSSYISAVFAFMLRSLGSWRLSGFIAAVLTCGSAAFAQTPATLAEQFTTPERIAKSTWWPTDGRPGRNEYVGSRACAQCHSAIVTSQAAHSMARASFPAESSGPLRDASGQSFHLGDYEYKVIRQADGTFHYTASNVGHTVSWPINWAFGAGKVGQSYLSEQNGTFHEVRFSYFSTLHAFDVTPNQAQQPATSVDKAASRVLSGAEAQRCFGCHTIASTTGKHFEPADAMAGISCEGCHGAGATHVAAIKAGEPDVGSAAIVNPKYLKPVDLVDFCGACHTTWWDAKRIGASGVANVRFQPYRLESSRCWGKGDVRLTCVSCHDPHQPLVREARAYDRNCLSCHAASRQTKATAASAAPCPVAKENCVSCHMPKYEVPDMHYQYTDHRIRIAKAGEAFPE
ncbi:MAG TPA: multiheme c-type cytochrome [Candidatus Sulfotelmatobacter sp.]